MTGIPDPVTNDADVIDSRDVIARIDYLRDMLDIDDDEREELHALEELATEGESLADWEYGEGLIRDTYFEEYARELADDIGAVSGDETWPMTCIDWERAARELRMDYTSVDFDGVTYWGRS